MARHLTNQEKAAFFTMLNEAMLVLRDNEKGFKENSRIGLIIQRKHLYESPTSEELFFKNNQINESEILIKTKDDPSDYTDDRTIVPIVPIEFEARFISPVSGVSIDEIKEVLNVEEYWIDDTGDKYTNPPGGLQISPRGTVFSYRYTGKQTPESKFSVTVFVTCLAPAQAEVRESVRWIDNVTIARDYPHLTPEMRKRKREEATARVRGSYGVSRGASQ